VQVIADIDSAAPIDDRTLASLSLQGITGLLYIDLEQDKNTAAPAALAQGERYPVIRSARSDFDVLLSSLPALATHAIDLVDRFDQLASDENVRAFTATLDNARTASAALPATIRDVQAMVADVRRSSQEVEGAAADARGIVAHSKPDIESALANIHTASDNLVRLSDRLDHFVADNEPGISTFTHQSLPELEQLLRETRQAARDFRDLSRSLKQNPSQLIYEPTYRGVEVAK